MFQVVPIDVARKRGYKKYFNGVPCCRGHLAERYTKKRACVACVRQDSYARSKTEKVKRQNKIYKQTEKYKSQQKKYKKSSAGKSSERRYAAKESTKIRMRQYQATEKYKAQRKKYRQTIKHKKTDREWRNKWKKTRSGAATIACRSMLHCVLRRTGQEKLGRVEVELGYSKEQFISHIEAQFLKGMNWRNHGEWHIDHIVPVSEFIKAGIYDHKKINALSNLRPIWAEENLAKKDKMEYLL